MLLKKPQEGINILPVFFKTVYLYSRFRSKYEKYGQTSFQTIF